MILEQEAVVQLFDTAERELRQQSTVAPTLDALISGLAKLRQGLSPPDWKRVTEIGKAHPVSFLIHEDPFARRSFEQPRGYPGDAKLIDYVYGNLVASDCSPLGKAISEYLVERPECVAARWRRDTTADLIDTRAAEVDRPHILSVAAGHMREIPKSNAVQRGAVGRIVAIDNDPQTMAYVDETECGVEIETVVAPITDLLRERLKPGKFDLIYTSGIYDYLKLRTGASLTRILIEMLRPGGQLMIANFLDPAPTAGFIEVFMNWEMYYRPLEILQKTVDSSDRHYFSKSFCDDNNAMGCLLIKKTLTNANFIGDVEA